jgi:hypothetical protein
VNKKTDTFLTNFLAYTSRKLVHTRRAHDQVFSSDRTQPLVAESGDRTYSIYRFQRWTREIWKSASARHASSGKQDLTRPAVTFFERSFRDLRSDGRLRTSLTRSRCRSFESRARFVGVPIAIGCAMRSSRVMSRRTRPSNRGLCCFPVDAVMTLETIAKSIDVTIHRYDPFIYEI